MNPEINIENKLKRFECISDVKTVTIILVLVMHCVLFYAGNPFFPEVADFYSPAVKFLSHMCDAIIIGSFMLCSGFLYANSVSRKKRSVAYFLKTRTLKFTKLYYIYGALWVVPLYTIFDISCFGRPEHAGWGEGYLYMLLGSFADHLWFLWLLIWISLIFILLKPLIEKKHYILTAVIYLAVILFIQLFLQDFPYFKLSQIPAFTTPYFLGILLYELYDSIDRLPLWGLAAIFGFLFLFVLLYDKFGESHFLINWLFRALGSMAPFFLFFMLEKSEFFVRLRNSRYWDYTQSHGLQLYLFNCPVNYLYFRLLYPLIGQNVFLCCFTNFVLSLTTLYILVFLQDKAKNFCTARISKIKRSKDLKS